MLMSLAMMTDAESFWNDAMMLQFFCKDDLMQCKWMMKFFTMMKDVEICRNDDRWWNSSQWWRMVKFFTMMTDDEICRNDEGWWNLSRWGMMKFVAMMMDDEICRNDDGCWHSCRSDDRRIAFRSPYSRHDRWDGEDEGMCLTMVVTLTIDWRREADHKTVVKTEAFSFLRASWPPKVTSISF